MHENIFWDKKITESEAKDILKDESNPRFVELASLLLSRSNDIKMVFKTYIDKVVFCRNWRKIKRKMRQDKWSDPRIDFWDQVYQVAREGVEMPKRPITEKGAVTPEIAAIGVIIRKARKAKRWTQKDLSANAKISQQMISYIEKGHSNFSIDTLAKIAAALDLKISIGQEISYNPPGHGGVGSAAGEGV
jgi:ribosome-binding protein aMBF1 (putative translation factor)